MSYSTRYFQLTPEILVEYNYNKVSESFTLSGNDKETIDIGEENGTATPTTGYVVDNGYLHSKTFLLHADEGHFVLPINKSESKFVQCVNGNSKIWEGDKFVHTPVSTSTGNEDYDDDILIDTFRLHFTSRNFFGDYVGIIISESIYDKNKNKIGILSYYIKKTDDPNINETPVLINQKLYTTYIDFVVPNVSAILNSNESPIKTNLPGEDILRKALFKSYDIMDNTPIIINAYGVKAIVENNNYEYYTTEKINSIYIPVIDKTNNVSINVNEADDGDYFEIYPSVDDNVVSFSDYLYNLSDGRPEIYIVFHELTLTEHYTDRFNKTHHDVTHHEQYIINANNEDEVDEKMLYRPILKNSANDISFTIDVKTHIINTLDNTTIVKCGACVYPDPDDPSQNAKKYGKRMNRIYLGNIPAQVNVYNKKPDIDIDGVKITNASSNVRIENHQHSVIGFIECTNVGVSVEQIPTEQIK